jgi:hypothetical protein
MADAAAAAGAAPQADDSSVPVFHDYTLRSDFER